MQLLQMLLNLGLEKETAPYILPLRSLMIYLDDFYKPSVSADILAFYDKIDMRCHFMQEVGYLEDSGHTWGCISGYGLAS